jgi:transglutaminase-like putative cysteine protease
MKYLFVILLTLSTMVHAAEPEYADLKSRTTRLYISYHLNDDYTAEKITEIEVKALTDDMAKKLKRRHFSHSTSIEKLEVLDAYTLKSDGTKIPVPKDNYQVTINKGNGKAGAIFSDRTSVSIVYPDLEKGDSVYAKVKKVDTESMFPKQFSASYYYYSQTAYDDVKVKFDLPESLVFDYEIRGMKEKYYTQGDRRIIELSYENKKPVKIDRDDFSVWDVSKEAGYALSTFPDYEAVAKAYGARALPKAKPTDKVKELAKEIINDEKDKKAKARLLYDWVATNISYAGNCIGVGAVVPHDTDFILDNRMGDCKDHATLLQALYAAVGIESTQALVNASSVYKLPRIPLVSSVNHVINYIPEWDQFVDSTSPSTPFDSLPKSDSDKPVLLVEGYKKGLKTPPTKVGANRQTLVTHMTIQNDGSVVGDVQIETKGLPAIVARKSFRHATDKQIDDWLKMMFSSDNKIGSASVDMDDPDPLLSEFKYSFNFKKPDFIPAKGAGGFYIIPPVMAPMSIYTILDYQNKDIEGYDVVCWSGYSVERMTYEFPDNMKIFATPDNMEISENYLSYKATYSLDGNQLNVVREIDDTTPGNVCSAELINKQRQTLIKISENLKSQVVYQK